MQWRIKEIEFGCGEALEREGKERVEKESRLYMVLDKLIERVGTVVVWLFLLLIFLCLIA